MNRKIVSTALVAGLLLSTTITTHAVATTTTPNSESSFTQEKSTGTSIQDSVNDAKNNIEEPSTKDSQKTEVNIPNTIKGIYETVSSIAADERNFTLNNSSFNKLATQLKELEQLVLATPNSVNSEVKNVLMVSEEAIMYIDAALNWHVYRGQRDGIEKAISTIAEVKKSLNINFTIATYKKDNMERYAKGEFVVENINVESTPNTPSNTTATSFSDIPTTHWAYKDIMAMTNKGLFSGTTTPINGIGTFEPNKIQSRAEFITVVVRALYQDELNTLSISKGKPWWYNAYTLSLNKGLLTPNELDKGDLAKDITRQEMALVLMRATEQLDETPPQLIDTGKIGDYNTIDTYYKEAVVKAYSMGLLTGTNTETGAFSPLIPLNRAAGAAVLNRLVDSSSRIKVDFNEVVVPPVQAGKYLTLEQTAARANVTLNYSDANRYEAKVGDKMVINGVTYDVVAHPSGAVDVHGMKVPYIKGVALDLGINTEFGPITSGYRNTVHSGERYAVSKYTGLGYWASQWAAIYNKCPAPTVDGTKDDQLSADNLWVWDAVADMWVQTVIIT